MFRKVREEAVPSGDDALDALAELLRTQGEFAFDTAVAEKAAIEEMFEGWARHLLVGAEPPGGVARKDGAPDWAGLRRFATQHRREECEYVVRSLSDLREALWLFIQRMGRAIPADRQCDESVAAELERLRASLDSNDTEEIRRVADESIRTIAGALRERSERSREQIERLATRVEEFAEQLVAARQQLERDSHTKLYNRGAFDEFLEKMTHLGSISGRTATLFLIDVDDFKWVNDHFGHPAGDAVIQEVARILAASFARRSDFVARYGGDEFAVIVQTESIEEDGSLGEACVLHVRDLEIPNGDDTIRVTLSVGAARLDPGESAEAWLARADRALYDAKEGGRDRFVAALDPLRA